MLALRQQGAVLRRPTWQQTEAPVCRRKELNAAHSTGAGNRFFLCPGSGHCPSGHLGCCRETHSATLRGVTLERIDRSADGGGLGPGASWGLRRQTLTPSGCPKQAALSECIKPRGPCRAWPSPRDLERGCRCCSRRGSGGGKTEKSWVAWSLPPWA